MKNIILIIAVLLSGIAFTQERIIDGDNRPQDYFPQKGDYIVYNSLKDFDGVFIWENNSGDRVEIVLREKKLCYEDNLGGFCAQTFVGNYEYENDAQPIIYKKEILQKNEIRVSDIKQSSPQIMSIGKEKNKITLSINDSKKDKHIVGIFTKLEDGKYLLLLKEQEGMTINRPGEEKEKGFTLPEEMILTKIN